MIKSALPYVPMMDSPALGYDRMVGVGIFSARPFRLVEFLI